LWSLPKYLNSKIKLLGLPQSIDRKPMRDYILIFEIFIPGYLIQKIILFLYFISQA
jgi:hypothetical protein